MVHLVACYLFHYDAFFRFYQRAFSTITQISASRRGSGELESCYVLIVFIYFFFLQNATLLGRPKLDVPKWLSAVRHGGFQGLKHDDKNCILPSYVYHALKLPLPSMVEIFDVPRAAHKRRRRAAAAKPGFRLLFALD